jgi:hypothetical protein
LKLNTSLYGSAGRGGGTGPRGANFRNATTDFYPFNKDLTQHYLNERRGARDANGFINFDAAVNSNISTSLPYNGPLTSFTGQLIGSNSFNTNNINRSVLVRRASMNSHDWVGGISNLEGQFGKFRTSIGIDLRKYKGFHYRVLTDLMGLNGYYSTGNRNSAGQIINTTVTPSPFNSTGIDGPKIDYFNNGIVGWQGVNGLVEFNDKKKLTAVIQAGLSNQSFQREDFFDQPAKPISDRKSIGGGYVKGGANFNVSQKSNVFFNTGYISRQPQFDAVFPNFANIVNQNIQNEEIKSLELGYGFNSKSLTVNVNLYSTTWGNRFITRALFNAQGDQGTAQFKDIDVRHNGIELEGTYRPNNKLKISFMTSVGDWKYTKDFTSELFNANLQSIGTGTLYLKNAKVGDAAQFTSYISTDYKITKKISADLGYRFVDGLYADYNVVDAVFTKPNNAGALKLPSYGLADLGFTARFGKISVRGNINNLLDEVYISESETNIHSDITSTTWKGIDVRNSVWFGFGRTWNLSVKYNF